MMDLIDRAEVHDLIAKRLSDYLTDESRKELEELDIKVEEDIPTVQEPSITWVTGADGAKIAFKDVPVWKVTKICEILADVVEVEEQEPKTGHWIAHSDGGIWIKYYECSKCGKVHDTQSDYCEKCGAKMAETQESEG